MQDNIIPAKRKLYRKTGITDILIGKGKYLLKEGNRLYLAQDDREEEAVLIKIGYSHLLNGFEFSGKSKNKLWIIVFNLKQGEFSLSLGDRIVSLLEKIKNKGIKFLISRPLPPCIFRKRNSIVKYNFPSRCKDCLELFIVDRKGDDNTFCGYKIPHFIFYKRGRGEVGELFENALGYVKLKRCGGCLKKEKCNFMLWSDNCYGGRKFKEDIFKYLGRPALGGGWIDKRLRKAVVTWWFLQNKWNVNSDIHIWQKLLKYQLKNEWLIDTGGAHGRNSFGLYKISKKTVLVEIGKEFFEYTKKRQGEKNVYFPMVNSCVTRMPFKDNTAGLTYSGGVLHTLTQQNKIKYLKECFRVLKYNSFLIGIAMAEWEVGKPADLSPIPHKKDLISLLKKAGFNSIKIIRKIRFDGSPLQTWFFMAAKSQPKEKAVRFAGSPLSMNGYYFSPSCWIVPVIRKDRIFALYDLKNDKLYNYNYISTYFWNILRYGSTNRIASYLKSKPREDAKNTEKELHDLLNKRLVTIHRRANEGE